jgi:5-oxoprolinase (ATP-hydrolysing)
MSTIYAHPLAGVLSAYGMGLADLSAHRQQTVEQVLSQELLPTMHTACEALAEQVRQELIAQQVDASAIKVITRLHLKYQGTDSALEVDVGTLADMIQSFETAYRQRFSFLMPARALIVETVSVQAQGGGAQIVDVPIAFNRDVPLQSARQRRMYSAGSWRDTPLYVRADLIPGDVIAGPAIIAESNQTTVVEAGCDCLEPFHTINSGYMHRPILPISAPDST